MSLQSQVDTVFVVTLTMATLVLAAASAAAQNTFPSSGNVGVGTTSPVYSLDVNGGTNAFRTKASTSSSNDTIATFESSSGIIGIIRANGKFGIGTITPTTALEVGRNAAGTPSGITITGGSTVAAPVLYFNYADAGTNLKRWMLFGDINGGFSIATQPDAGGAANQKFFVSNAGDVGINTTTPAEKLEVSGNLKVSGTGNINAAGTIEGNVIKAKYQDVAEWVESSQELAAGTVVVLDGSKSNHVVASTKSYDSRIAGVISLQPGLTLGEGGDGRVLVASTGRVKVKVDARNGPINIGDLLVTSDKTGVAMKSVPVRIGRVRMHRPGTLIGKALEPLPAGTGEILVLLSLQ